MLPSWGSPPYLYLVIRLMHNNLACPRRSYERPPWLGRVQLILDLDVRVLSEGMHDFAGDQ